LNIEKCVMYSYIRQNPWFLACVDINCDSGPYKSRKMGILVWDRPISNLKLSRY